MPRVPSKELSGASVHLMSLCMVRGPLPEGHPKAGVLYFCPDADVPLAASGLATTPVLQKYAYTEKEAVLLEAHRAPDEWFAAACRMPHLTIQGDPDARRPSTCALFAAELDKQPAVPRCIWPHLRCMPTLSSAIPLAKGRRVVLCGTYEMRDRLFAHLRPRGMQAGDGMMDRYGRYTALEKRMHAPWLSVDGGRRMVREDAIEQHVVVSPSNIRSGEYDTVIVMPDVPESFGRSICRRARYMVVAIGHSPRAYVQ